MNRGKILEIFQSVQGEGKYAGVHQVFVRFFECNMHCDWCDTPHSIGDTVRHYEQYSLDEVCSKVNELWDHCHSLSLTGGEPLLQKDFIKILLPRMKQKSMRAYLETNGILPDALADLIGEIDIIAMDLKLPSSTRCRPYWDEHEAFLKIAREQEVFVKAVISSETKEDDIKRAVELVNAVAPGIELYLQPNYFDRQNGVLRHCLEAQKKFSGTLKNIRVLPQVHKYMKIP